MNVVMCKKNKKDEFKSKWIFAWFPHIASDKQGNLHLVWFDYVWKEKYQFDPRGGIQSSYYLYERK